MAVNCATGSILVSRSTTSSTAVFQLYKGAYSGNEAYGVACYTCYGLNNPPTTQQGDETQTGYPASGEWIGVVSNLAADKTYFIRARVINSDAVSDYGSTKSKRMGAVLATASTPTSSSVAATTATVACNYYPNTLESSCSAQLQYKKTSDADWTNAGTAGTDGGYVQRTETENLTGLTASTQYQTRLVITRTTSVSADNTVTSATGTFTTLADSPTVTTDAASSVGITGATLNATVAVGAQAGNCDVKWVYKLTSPPEGGTTVASDSNPLAADGSYSKGITGLTASTLYYARATVYWPTGTTTNSAAGDIVSFTTTADPGATASDEDHMQTQYVDAIYGHAVTVPFVLRSPAATSSNEFYTGDAPVDADDVNMWQDGVDINVGAGVTFAKVVGTAAGTALYTIVIAAADTDCDILDVVVHDKTATEAFRDHHIQVRTKQNLSAIVVDSTHRTNSTAVTITGSGTGAALSCVGGATGKDIDGYVSGGVLYWGDDCTSSGTTNVGITTGTGPYNYIATADAYNGHIVVILAGTGAGQARAISDYDGAGALTVSPAFATALGATGLEVAIIPAPIGLGGSPGVELASLPTATSTYGAMLQFLFQWAAYKKYQDASQKILYKADSSTVLATGSFEDNTTDQTLGKLA